LELKFATTAKKEKKSNRKKTNFKGRLRGARTGNLNKQTNKQTKTKNKNTTIISNLLVVTSQLSVSARPMRTNTLCWSQEGVIKSLATKIRVRAKCTLFGSD